MGKKTCLISLLFLILSVIFFEFTNLDVWLQNHFYDFEVRHWWVDANEPLWRGLFYIYPKRLIYIFSAFLAGFGLYWWKKKTHVEWRRGCSRVLLSLIVVPLLAVGGKDLTRVHCPYNLKMFNGFAPYVKLFEKMPEDYKGDRGRCFPAGHASGGFALFSLYFLFRKKNWRRFGWMLGFSIGWAMALYQTFKGAHFLSHTLFTMLMALAVISGINLLLGKYEKPGPLKNT